MTRPLRPGGCPLSVRRPVMLQRWELLTFLHWRFAAEEVQRLLPAGLSVEEHSGSAWVGLVPFRMQVSPPGLPAPPWLGRFCETNVRTYVRDEHARSGVWFFSLDAARLAAVVTARVTYRLPYFWSAMTAEQRGSDITYRARRRWPRPEATSEVSVRVGAPYRDDELGALDHFLTARFRLFSATAGGLRYADAEHAPWPLRRAEVLTCDDRLLEAAGLPTPTAAPLGHFSEGVDVRIGNPHSVQGTSPRNRPPE